MVVLARNDLKDGEVTVGPEHGGCGRTHKYVIGPTGYPQIECPMCEDFLRGDPLHSTVAAKVPMTYDEELVKKDLDDRGARNQSAMTALALAKIAGIPGAETALGMAMGAGAANCPNDHPVTPGVKFCPQCGAQVSAPSESRMFPCGHANPSSARFCAECGGPAEVPVAAASNGAAAVPGNTDTGLADLLPPSGASQKPAPPSLPSNSAMRRMKGEDLAELAAGAGIATGGTRQDVLDRLIAANNGSRGA